MSADDTDPSRPDTDKPPPSDARPGHPRPPIEEQFAALDESSRNLSLDVSSLNTTLQAVTALQFEQREQRTRQLETDRQVEKQKTEMEERDKRTRQTAFSVAVTLAVLLPLVSVLVYLSLLMHVNDLLTQQDRDRYAGCVIRNSATQENVNREQRLAALETNPQLKTVHQNSAVQLRKGLVNCGRLK